MNPIKSNKPLCKLLTPNPVYKPFSYPWSFDAWQTQNRVHWLPEEVPLAEDVRDWKDKLSSAEINLLTQIFRFFTQQDIEVGGAYTDLYLSVFKPTEVRMMLTQFAAMETTHVAAYSYLLDTIGMPEVEYSAFLEYKEMKAKFDYMHQFGVGSPREIAKALAVFSAFTEGLQLFASFAMLMNFPRFNKMKGMGQIVAWSVRDETLHVENMIHLFRAFVEENREIWDDELKKEIYDICREMVDHEDAFINLAFEMGPVEGMTADDLKSYIRYIADRRLIQLGLKPNYGVKKNPIPWMDEMLNATEHMNFFEGRATEYSRAATTGTWDDAFAMHDAEKYTIYGQVNCGQCVRAKNLLTNKGVAFEYIDLTSDPNKKADLIAHTRAMSMPIIFKGDKYFGGIFDLESKFIVE